MIDASIPARHFSVATKPRTVSLIVVHTTENDCRPGVARAVAKWFASTAAPQASAHYVVGPDETIRCVPDEHVAWHCGRFGNGRSIGVEIVGRAAMTPEQWAKDAPLEALQRAAKLVAYLCCKHNVEPVKRSAADIKAGIGGVCGHADITVGIGGTDHTDPGKSFPWESFMRQVQDAMTPRL